MAEPEDKTFHLTKGATLNIGGGTFTVSAIYTDNVMNDWTGDVARQTVDLSLTITRTLPPTDKEDE